MFDQAADATTNALGQPQIFLICLLGFIAWVVIGVILGSPQLWVAWGGGIIAGVTLVLVALLENEQQRTEQAMHRKLNAMADALAQFMEAHDGVEPDHVHQLRTAVGLEQRESASDSQT
ncbi:MAG: low affinity iron permease family protein [Actinomycetota bacterium]|nr:low affinity iron permease family protein [Actinomycetota bacterium]